MNAARIATFCVIAIAVTIGVSSAQDEGPWWDWSTIDGNWGGFRQALADRGLVFFGTTLVDLQGNVSGGERRAFAPADASLVAADADLQKLAGLDGLLFHAEFVAMQARIFLPRASAIFCRLLPLSRSRDTI